MQASALSKLSGQPKALEYSTQDIEFQSLGIFSCKVPFYGTALAFITGGNYTTRLI
jgi:hypothetical protein